MMKKSLTERGFQRIDWLDLYRQPCSLQQSSLALYSEPGAGAVWLGQGENRMHLSVSEVDSLIAYLQNWMQTGKLFDPELKVRSESQSTSERSAT